MSLSWLLILAALTILAASPLWAQKRARQEGQRQVTENHPNGKPFRVYSVDAEGRKDGKLEQFAPGGHLELRASYAADKLHGRLERFSAGGTKLLSAHYSKGRKHGAWREFAEDGHKIIYKSFRYNVLDGRYQTFHSNGQKKLATAYRNGQLDGRYQQFAADQSWSRDAVYKAGKLHGKVLIKRGRKVVSRQRWQHGEITDLDGIRPFPRDSVALRNQLSAILRPAATPESSPLKKPRRKRPRAKKSKRAKGSKQKAPDPQATVRTAALRRLQAYRYLCGLRYEDMELVAKWNDLCDAAAEVCRANGGLSHSPPRPSGFDAARYAKGRIGASNSNLAIGSGMVRSVDSYMDDSDPSNIDRIGHRRWCLNPAMKLTGFGGAGRFSAMWSMDASGRTPAGMAAVFYPPQGRVPVDFFGPRHAWSISILRGGVPKKGRLRITVHELDQYFQPIGKGLELDHLGLAGGGFGAGTCLVFRPVGLQVQPGRRYLARISFDGGKTATYRYVVAFCAAVEQ